MVSSHAREVGGPRRVLPGGGRTSPLSRAGRGIPTMQLRIATWPAHSESSFPDSCPSGAAHAMSGRTTHTSPRSRRVPSAEGRRCGSRGPRHGTPRSSPKTPATKTAMESPPELTYPYGGPPSASPSPKNLGTKPASEGTYIYGGQRSPDTRGHDPIVSPGAAPFLARKKWVQNRAPEGTSIYGGR